MNSEPGPSPAGQLRMGLGLARFTLRAATRNRAGYFFSLFFPLVFVAVFGLISAPRPVIKLGVSDRLELRNPVFAAMRALEAAPHAPVQLVRGTDAALEHDLRRDRVAGILAPAESGGTISLVTSGGSPHARSAAERLVAGVLAELSLGAAGVTTPAFRPEKREIPGRQFRYIDFALPGQVGFAMLSLATFGVGYLLGTLRKTLVLKRMVATSVRPLTFVVALCLGRSVQAVVQAGLLIGIGVLAFRFPLAHGWLSAGQMLLLSFLGIMAFLGFGVLISNVARDDQSLPVALNLFNLPQVLLAGVFFPLDGMPAWVQTLGSVLPLSCLTGALRQTALDGAGLLELWPAIFGLLAWGSVACVLAARTFRAD